MTDRFRYVYEGEDSHGMPVWSCTRVGGGIAGYGPTQKDALQAFLDLEDDVLPVTEQRTISPFEPPERVEVWRDRYTED